MSSGNRQMSLVGFMQAGSTTVYAGSWRHPATEHGFLSHEFYQKLGRTLEEGCFDWLLAGSPRPFRSSSSCRY